MATFPPRYRVFKTPAAKREFRSLAPDPHRKARDIERDLRFGPVIEHSKQLELADRSDMWRVKFGDWRIVFRLDEANRVIEITRIRPRKTAYIGIERTRHQ